MIVAKPLMGKEFIAEMNKDPTKSNCVLLGTYNLESYGQNQVFRKLRHWKVLNGQTLQCRCSCKVPEQVSTVVAQRGASAFNALKGNF